MELKNFNMSKHQFGQSFTTQCDDFSWLENRSPVAHSVCTITDNQLAAVMEKITAIAHSEGVILHYLFADFFSSVKYLKRIRSWNGDSFKPAEEFVCINNWEDQRFLKFISDQQNTHFYYLALEKNTGKSAVVWSEHDLYDDEESFSVNDIYFMDDNFAHFILSYQNFHEQIFRAG